jgi:ankyrin repeat protein
VKSNADIWIKNKRGDYPINEAVHAVSFTKVHHQTNEFQQLQIGCFDIIRYVFKLYPKKINIRNGEQRTPLHLAASLGDIEMCQVLIQCGARINAFIQTTAVSYLFFVGYFHSFSISREII